MIWRWFLLFNFERVIRNKNFHLQQNINRHNFIYGLSRAPRTQPKSDLTRIVASSTSTYSLLRPVDQATISQDKLIFGHLWVLYIGDSWPTFSQLIISSLHLNVLQYGTPSNNKELHHFSVLLYSESRKLWRLGWLYNIASGTQRRIRVERVPQ